MALNFLLLATQQVLLKYIHALIFYGNETNTENWLLEINIACGDLPIKGCNVQ